MQKNVEKAQTKYNTIILLERPSSNSNQTKNQYVHEINQRFKNLKLIPFLLEDRFKFFGPTTST